MTSIVDVTVIPLPETVHVYVPDWPGITAVALAREIILPVVVLIVSTFKSECRFPVVPYISVNDQDIVGKGSPVPAHFSDISTPGFVSTRGAFTSCPLTLIKVSFGDVVVEEPDPPLEDEEPASNPATIKYIIVNYKISNIYSI